MADTEQSPPQSAAEKLPTFSFSIWPPTERTRDAVRNRLIDNLSTPSILSKKYGTVSRGEAVDAAARIEEEAFGVAGKVTGTDDDGIEILQVYSKEISRRMLDTMKARSGGPVASETPPEKPEVVAVDTMKATSGDPVASETPPENESEINVEEEAASTAAPQNDKLESLE